MHASVGSCINSSSIPWQQAGSSGYEQGAAQATLQLGQQITLSVAVPPGVTEGQQLQVQVPGGGTMVVAVPAGVPPGGTFQALTPATPVPVAIAVDSSSTTAGVATAAAVQPIVGSDSLQISVQSGKGAAVL